MSSVSRVATASLGIGASSSMGMSAITPPSADHRRRRLAGAQPGRRLQLAVHHYLHLQASEPDAATGVPASTRRREPNRWRWVSSAGRSRPRSTSADAGLIQRPAATPFRRGR